MRLMTEEETEIAVAKHTRRRKTFEDEGLSADDAWDLADRLWERDADSFDDRRVCFECKKYDTKNKTCPEYVDRYGKPERPPRFTLQRCPWLDLKGKK
jgi:hypothetical protein